MPNRNVLSRRRLLTGLGGAALALPLLRRIPSAEAAVSPKRLLVLYTGGDGVDQAHWRPTVSGTSFALPSVLPAMLAPLEPHASKIALFDGIDDTLSYLKQGGEGGHLAAGHVLTAAYIQQYSTEDTMLYWAGGPSIDQVIADHLGVKALTLGCCIEGSYGDGRICSRGPSQPVAPNLDPIKAFNEVLGTAALPPEEAAALVDRRKRVLDVVGRELNGTMAQLPASDRRKLEVHLELLDRLDKRLASNPLLNCTPVAPPTVDYLDYANHPLTSRAMIDIAVQALACDATRVATIQFGDSGPYGTPYWPDEGVLLDRNEHEIAHDWENAPGDPGNEARRVELETYYYRLLAYVLAQLDAVPDGDGTLLDHTYVYWTKCMSAQGHNSTGLFNILAGAADGGVPLGRYTSLPNVAQGNMLLTILHLMGLTHLSTFGDPGGCTGLVNF